MKFASAGSFSGQVLKTDICIIGAGVAGITIATEMIGSGRQVLVLESGALEPDDRTQALYEGKASQQVYDISGSRLRQFGGSSNHWEGFCMPLTAYDMQPRPWVPLSGWPIAHDALTPHYARAEKILGLDPLAAEAPKAKFKDMEMLCWRFAKRLRFGVTFQKELEAAENIRVVLGANVTGIHLEKESNRIDHVQVRSLEGASFTVEAKTFVLACGGIENARILLYSNDVVPAGLGNQNDMVGRCFMEHLCQQIGTLYSYGKPEFIAAFTQQIPKPYTRTKPLPPLWAMSPSVRYMEEKQLLATGIRFDNEVAATSPLPPQAAYMREIAGKGSEKLYSSRVLIHSEQSPDPASRVLLDAASKDALGLPSIELQWKLNELDKTTLMDASALFASNMPPDKGVLRLDKIAYEQGWPRMVYGSSHHMGTTRMGNDPKTSVVDAQCRLHGVANMYIAGSSVFPTGGFANPTFTIVAMSLMLADQLKLQ